MNPIIFSVHRPVGKTGVCYKLSWKERFQLLWYGVFWYRVLNKADES